MNATQRAIKEGLNDYYESRKPEPTKSSKLYRLVLMTQIHENYGTEETPRWKPKGGSEYHVILGSETVALTIDQRGLTDALLERLTKYGTMFTEYVHSWYVAPLDEETPDETMWREMREWGYLSKETHERYLRDMLLTDIDFKPFLYHTN